MPDSGCSSWVFGSSAWILSIQLLAELTSLLVVDSFPELMGTYSGGLQSPWMLYVGS